MAKSQVNLGSLPVMRGAYDATANYYKENEVTMYSMTFRAKQGTVASPMKGAAPAQMVNGVVSLINTDKWVLTAGSPEIANQAETLAGLIDGSTQAGSAKEADVAGDLEAWEGWSATVEETFDAVVRTTAGDTSIETDDGGVLRSIVAKTDFAASEFRATGFNLLRDAVAVGNGYFFLVPALPFGTFGTATRPNGLLFTNAQGENLKPTVYFKPMADGEPTSVTDGTVCPYTDANGYRFYNPAAVGFIIVSGITLNTTCAHVAWSRRYDEYKAVNAAGDAGSTIALTNLIAAIQPVALKMLVCGAVADRIDWLVNGTATWQRNVGLTTPEWTTVADEVEEGATQTYTHSAVIVDMKDGGAAELYGATGITFQTNGTTISYQDTSSVATDAQVKYELSAPVTGTLAVANTFALEDWGLEKMRSVVGTAYISTEYKQGIADTYLAAAQQTSKLRYNAGQVSLGFGVCPTVADEVAKVVTISDFLLLTNGLVTVVFTQGITATGATLNVSGTGAKPILVNGNPIEAGIIGPHTTAQLIYDGTAWHLVSMMAQILNPADLFVDMGLESGVKWAKANIDLTQANGFAKSPFQYECSFFSWGNIFGHNPKTNTTFDYDWGGANNADPCYEGQVYGSTPGNTLTASFSADGGFDAARVNLGAPWRMPTSAEFVNLFANIIYIDANGNEVDTTMTDKRVTVNGVTGLYLQSKINGNRLFFPCSGYGAGRSRDNRGSYGYYWSSTWYSARYARVLGFSSGGVFPQNNGSRYVGVPVRAVQ